MMMGALGNWIKETVINDHYKKSYGDVLHNPLQEIVNEQEAHPMTNQDLVFSFSPPSSSPRKRGEEEESINQFELEESESDYDENEEFEHSLFHEEEEEEEEEQDIEQQIYYATEEDAVQAFVQEYTSYLSRHMGHVPHYDTDLLFNIIQIHDIAYLPLNHPLVNMIVQDNELHPEEVENQCVGTLEKGHLVLYRWSTVDNAISSVREMFLPPLVEAKKGVGMEQGEESKSILDDDNEPLF